DAEAVGRLIGVPRMWSWMLWTGIGPFGLYPFSPPYPVRLRQRVGAPIDPWHGGEPRAADPDGLFGTHRHLIRAAQAVLDHAAAGQGDAPCPIRPTRPPQGRAGRSSSAPPPARAPPWRARWRATRDSTSSACTAATIPTTRAPWRPTCAPPAARSRCTS